ncbi:peptidylprolyl isomerase [candidate division KSB1 bacterium]|nr:peptidylprolyl isomerase [candidate division KSB1 bacterium]
MRNHSMGFLLLILMSFFLNCGSKDGQPVATVGDKSITLAEFKEKFSEGKAENSLAAVTDSAKLVYLNQMIDNNLKVLAAYQKGVDKDSMIQLQIANIEKDRVARKVWEVDVINKLVTETQLREIFEKSQKEVKIRDLVLRFVKNDSVDTEPDVKEMIEKIHSYLKKGAKFDSLAKRYSQDRNTASKGGERGVVRWNSWGTNDELNQTAFNLKEGEISAPFKLKNEYHIIKVDQITSKPTVTKFENEKQRIIGNLLSQQGAKVEEQKNLAMDNLIKKFNGGFIEENVALMIKKINTPDSLVDSAQRQPSARFDPFSTLTDDDTSRVLFSYAKDQKISIGYVSRLMRTVDPMRRPALNTETDLQNIVKRMLLFPLFAHEGYNRKYNQDKEVVKEITDIKENNMLKTIFKQEVQNRVKPTEAEIFAHYETNKEKYKQAEKRNVQEIWITDPAKAQMAIKEVRAKRDFTAVAKKYNERATTKANGGMLGFIQENQWADMGKEAFKMQIGDISDLIKMGSNFSIIKLLEIQPETIQPFEQVRFQVENELRKVQLANREREWIEQLRKENSIKIDEKLLAGSFKEESGS